MRYFLTAKKHGASVGSQYFLRSFHSGQPAFETQSNPTSHCGEKNRDGMGNVGGLRRPARAITSVLGKRDTPFSLLTWHLTWRIL
jgi:hypothetical protein